MIVTAALLLAAAVLATVAVLTSGFRVRIYRVDPPPHVELVATDVDARGFFVVTASKLDYELLLEAGQTYPEYVAACGGAQTSPLTEPQWEQISRALGARPT